MVWCLMIPACLAVALALAALLAPPRIALPRPGRVVRSCAATALALIAVTLMGLAVLLQEALS